MKRYFYAASGIALIALLTSGCYQGSSTKSAASSTTATSSSAEASKPAATAANATPGETVLTGGLKYTDLKVGDGEIAEPGLTASVHYTGWLVDGTKFDSSVDRGTPFQFKIGAGGVIKGWDQGVVGMRVGGKRHLTIPPDMGYGANGYPPVIPPNSVLVFDVELLNLTH